MHNRELILTKTIAMQGTALLANVKEYELCAIFPRSLVKTAQTFYNQPDVSAEMEIARSVDGQPRELGEGGILSALWNFMEELECGMEVDMRAIPIRQETVEICEHFDLNPYYMLSGGAVLMAVEEGFTALQALGQVGIQATIIGSTNQSNDRIIYNLEHNRFLDRPQREELYKIFPNGWNIVEG